MKMKQSTKYAKIFCNLLLALAVVLLLVFALPKVIVFFMPFVVGFLLSLIANPLVRFLEKHIKIRRKYGTVLIIVLVIGAVILICYGAVVLVLHGISGFAAYLPTMSANAGLELEAAADKVQEMMARIPFLADVNVHELGVSLSDALGTLVSGKNAPMFEAVSGFAQSIPNMLVGTVMGVLATYFFVADREVMEHWLKTHLPESFQKKTMHMYRQIMGAVGGYFQAQVKIMFVIYVIVAVGLMILRVQYAWLIGFGIAFLDMLPVFGTGTVLVPWAVIKLFVGNYRIAVGMLILYIVTLLVHQLIQPKLVGESVGMSPFVTLFYMYIGYQFGGVLGMIIAIPAGMLLINFYRAGAFDKLIWCIREIVSDFNRFRRIPHVHPCAKEQSDKN